MSGLIIDNGFLRQVASGDDVSHHYLDAESNDFKILRHKQVVYAVRLNDAGIPNAAVKLWKSHKGEKKFAEQELGRGVAGIVKEKTIDKAVKKFKYRLQLMHTLESNKEILRQKFFLAEKEADSIFIFGLHNIKNFPDTVFHMPRAEALINYSPKGDARYASAIADGEIPDKYADMLSDDTVQSNFESFFATLKKVNDSGYYHPDYVTGLTHRSFQNQLYSTEGFKLFDLDSGLSRIEKPSGQDEEWLKERKIAARDQWVIAYNHLVNEGSEWKTQIKEFYKNNNCALSEKPEVLLELGEQEIIVIPETVKSQLLLDITKNAVNFMSDQSITSEDESDADQPGFDVSP